jgi:hypothetical protein
MRRFEINEELEALIAELDLPPSAAARFRRETTVYAQVQDGFQQLGQPERGLLLINAVQTIISETANDAYNDGLGKIAELITEAYRRGQLDQLAADCAAVGCQTPTWAIAEAAEIDERRAIRLDDLQRRRIEAEQLYAQGRSH